MLNLKGALLAEKQHRFGRKTAISFQELIHEKSPSSL